MIENTGYYNQDYIIFSKLISPQDNWSTNNWPEIFFPVSGTEATAFLYFYRKINDRNFIWHIDTSK